MLLIILFAAVLLLTYANGANDNFKGTATLWGSNTLGYRQSLLLATVCTFAGSLCSGFFAQSLIKNFSGQGLVPDALVHSVPFVLSVALGAAATVLLATKLGFPVSTTHGIVGALVGAGLIGATGDINLGRLGDTFFLPLIAGPLMAVGLTAAFYPVVRHLRKIAGITSERRLEAERPALAAVSVASSAKQVHMTATPPLKNAQVSDDRTSSTASRHDTTRYTGAFLGIPFQTLVDKLHYVSGGAVCFARSLNDTPKFLGLLLLCQFFELKMNIFLLALVMVVGGLLHSKRVAHTMSKKITRLNAGQGLTANLSTSFLVIVASKFGLPVSTTHVSVGSIFGIGIVNGSADKKQMKSIVASWILTLPIAAFFSALFFLWFSTL